MLGSFGWTKTIMAAETSVIVEESKKETCTLLEEDIPGAALPRESVEEYRMVQLKRWLTCRGAKTSECFCAQVSLCFRTPVYFVLSFASEQHDHCPRQV